MDAARASCGAADTSPAGAGALRSSVAAYAAASDTTSNRAPTAMARTAPRRRPAGWSTRLAATAGPLIEAGDAVGCAAQRGAPHDGSGQAVSGPVPRGRG